MGATGVVVVAIIAVAAIFAFNHSSSSHAATTTDRGSGGGSGGASATTASTLPPLTVASITPAAATQQVVASSPIQITFSQSLATNSPTPTLSPAVAGSWSVAGSTMTFHPSGGYLPYTTYQVTVPTTVTTPEVHKAHATLATAYTSTFKVAAGSPLRVEQLLAELDYMPLSFVATPAAGTPSTTTAPTTPTTAGPAAPGASTTSTTAAATTTATPTAASTLAGEATAADAVATVPANGTLAWRFPNTPSTLQSLWTPGVSNVIDQGAIMAFENANGMKMDGVAGPAVWAALVKAVAARTVTTQPYNYLVASKVTPETLTVWQNGTDIYTTPANTGVAAAPTPNGTWPVYDRYASTTMKGHNPDGSTYNDPGIPWVAYFHGGDAVHGFNRGSYGVPQSVGCVELPEANAKIVYNYDPYGTLVTVTG